MILNKYFLRSSVALYCWVFLLLSSCATNNSIRLSTNKRLSQALVANKIAECLKDKKGSVIFVDPLLKDRSTIFNRHEFLDASRAYPDLFYDKIQNYAFPFLIPDSLASQTQYINKKADLENGTDFFSFFHPCCLPRRGIYMPYSVTIFIQFKIAHLVCGLLIGNMIFTT